jgi:hypothetical protein
MKVVHKHHSKIGVPHQMKKPKPTTLLVSQRTLLARVNRELERLYPTNGECYIAATRPGSENRKRFGKFYSYGGGDDRDIDLEAFGRQLDVLDPNEELEGWTDADRTWGEPTGFAPQSICSTEAVASWPQHLRDLYAKAHPDAPLGTPAEEIRAEFLAKEAEYERTHPPAPPFEGHENRHGGPDCPDCKAYRRKHPRDTRGYYIRKETAHING